jgi:2,3-bisphosphoglycerate-dependent phosphoglycerate mutase
VSATLILVRHATPFTPEPGGPDDHHRRLTPAGEAQARLLAAELTSPAPAAVISSPYLRAVQTVRPTADACGLTVTTDHLMREWDSGLAPTPDYARHHAASWADPARTRPGGESLDQLTRRAGAALTALAARYDGAPVIVGSHGTFIARALIAFGAPEIDWHFSRGMPMPAVYRIRLGPGGTSITGPGLRT